MLKADGTYIKEINKIEKHDLLILDDFGLQKLDSYSRMALLEIMEDRHAEKSTIISSQLPVDKFNLRETLFSKNWVVYSKESFKTEASVFEYLGRYTHKIAISNHRIRQVTNEIVSFEYTDRAAGYKKRIRTLAGEDFIKLFLRHVLPPRFIKIRSYGFLASRTKTNDLTRLREYFKLSAYEKPVRLKVAEILELVWGVKPGVCPKCGGRLLLTDHKARPRASPVLLAV